MFFAKDCGNIFLMTTLIIIPSIGLSAVKINSRKNFDVFISELTKKSETSRVLTLSLGSIWENAGNTQTFYLAPNIEKTYAAKHASQNLVSGEIFLGIQKTIHEKLRGQIGFAVAKTGNATLQGNIWDDAQPQFNNYIYSYQINHTHVALKGKLLAKGCSMITPWVSASLGIGFNEAHSFESPPLLSQAVAIPNFANNSTTSFAYTTGIGIEKNINLNWTAGIGYEFSDWGKSQLNRASGQALNSGLSLSHLYTNGILFNLTYYT